VTWILDVNGRRVEFTTAQLLSYKDFQMKVVEATNILPKPMKNWHKLVQPLLDNVEEILAPEDAGALGEVMGMVETFCNTRPAKLKDEILQGKVWTDEDAAYFRSSDLKKYLQRERMFVGPRELWNMLERTGACHSKTTIKGKTIRVWSIPKPDQQTEAFDLPEIMSNEF